MLFGYTNYFSGYLLIGTTKPLVPNLEAEILQRSENKSEWSPDD